MSPIIVERFTERPVVYADVRKRNKLVAVGSIAHNIRTGDTVWGTGAMYENSHRQFKHAKILALRGPLTAKLLRWKGDVFGDPAMLLPMMHLPPAPLKQFKVGYIPHYVDMLHPYFVQRPAGSVLIDVHWGLTQFVAAIRMCDAVVSSSLHGIIIAEAYGIPAAWAKVSPRVKGDGFKFRDYYEGTGRIPKQDEFMPNYGNYGGRCNALIRALRERYNQ